jgi:hypothetical protein
MQYSKPDGDFFAGDCMPFFHDGVFHLFYLLDENHHRALGGLGGHQWAHASTTDLVHWQHHPLALAITAPHEGSICTGSVYYHAGTFYAFYATRLRDWRQQLNLAISKDAIHFTKIDPQPLAVPPAGYSPYHFRDPQPFEDAETGLFHMLVSAELEPATLAGRGGCLAHLVSADLDRWQPQQPLLVPGFGDVPECPDYFHWNGWYYLIFSNALTARYRMSRRPLGPWLRPAIDTLDGPLARVMKTAAFTGDRRIGVAWIGTRTGDRDDGQPQWGGNLLFREIVQEADGTLAACFPAEMVPSRSAVLPLAFPVLTPGVTVAGQQLRLHAPEGMQAAGAAGIPHHVHITADITPDIAPSGQSGAFGMRFRSTEAFSAGYDLTFLPSARMVKLNNESIFGVDGLDQPFRVEIVLKDDIIDVCIGNRRLIVDRCPERRGDYLFCFAQDATITIANLEVRPLR